MEEVENDNKCSKDSRTWTKRETWKVFKICTKKTIVSIWEQGCEMHVL